MDLRQAGTLNAHWECPFDQQVVWAGERDGSPTHSAASFSIEFNEPDDARRVHELMEGGMKFQEAIDYLELRPNEHFVATRTDGGPDGTTP
jgi:hypothetical protein